MQYFQNLLYVTHGATDETASLKQALSLARNNSASLTILILSPELPEKFADVQDKYARNLKSEVESSIQEAKATLNIEKTEVKLSIEIASDKMPAIKVIQLVLQNDYDLVLKEAEQLHSRGGFKAIDMELLRQCPVPVWLSRPITQHRNAIKVAVAIDPDTQEAAAQHLSKRMLKLARSLADSCSGTLYIASCWELEFESSLRNSPFYGVSDKEVDNAVTEERERHRMALDNLITESEISGQLHVCHLQGKPDDLISTFVEEQGIDILIMGTVARTGIAGFVTGNTAENVMQALSCSLLALKPNGFICPIKA
ncbi:universal stress protein [Planctobacterium marinum]|uniref:Universal stress protein n=1 Tax=Planctobacterium marinum TaxID=1631968 RepID=A0AA48KVH3_9ALTE|nr:universal stress protein [Planctobacterium marinum]